MTPFRFLMADRAAAFVLSSPTIATENVAFDTRLLQAPQRFTAGAVLGCPLKIYWFAGDSSIPPQAAH